MNRARIRTIMGGSVAATVLIVDQLSKLWALAALQVQGESQPLFGLLKATLVFNRSNAFGVVPVAGDLSRWGLVSFNLAAAAALVWWLARYRHSRLSAIGAGLLIGGAVGNGLDRLRLGYVVDFVDASALHFNWVFNIADAAVNLGICCVLLSAVILPAMHQRRGVQIA